MAVDQSGSGEAFMLEGIHIKERDYMAKQEARALGEVLLNNPLERTSQGPTKLP